MGEEGCSRLTVTRAGPDAGRGGRDAEDPWCVEEREQLNAGDSRGESGEGERVPSGSSGSRVDEGFVNNRAAIRRLGKTRTHAESGQDALPLVSLLRRVFLFIIGSRRFLSTDITRRSPSSLIFLLLCSRSSSASFSPPPPPPPPSPLPPSPPQPPLFYLYHRNEVEEGTSWTFPVESREATFTRTTTSGYR